jgi:predicted HTH transcriptional regulator
VGRASRARPAGGRRGRAALVAAEILHQSGPPTIGGLLCYGREPHQRLAYATVSGVAYGGTAVERELLDRAAIAGRVEEQVEAAALFIERNIRAPSTVEGLERIEPATVPRGHP